MKKYFLIILFLTLIILIGSLFLFKNEKSTLKKVKVAEVTHSIFYTPQYVAHALGYFENEGLDVEIILTAGADKVTAAVLSGDVQIGFCGSEATIYDYNQGEKDYLVNFAGLTKKDGSFIVSRKKIDNFNIQMLKNSYIIGGRKGGMPEMTLEYILKKHNINPKKDLTIDTSIAFSAMSGAFIGGTGDFVTLFEPNALSLEKNNFGYVVASLGELGGEVPYTVYNAKKSYIDKNKDIILGFTKAIQKGIDYVKSHESKEIASIILNYFPDVSLDDLTIIIERYKKIDSWYDNVLITEENFNHVQEIMESAGELTKKAPYDKLVTTYFAKKIITN